MYTSNACVKLCNLDCIKIDLFCSGMEIQNYKKDNIYYE